MSFLPQVKMDFIPSDEEDANDNINDEMDDFDQDKDTNVDDTNVDETKEVLDEIVPKAKSKRDHMNVNEIFNMPENHSPINAQGTESVAPLENVKLTKKGKPRKKRPPMTEEHKEKLKAARVKAMAARKAKAVERKESKALEKEEKELLKKQKVKRVRALKEEVEDDVEPKPIKDIANEVAQRVKEQTFTKQDLEDAQLNAIMNYEKIRKSRKEKKKVDQEKNKEQEAIRNQLRRAVAPPQEEYNPFNGICY